MQKIIDFHAHVFPEKVALKASAAIGDFYGIHMGENGTLEHLMEEGAKINVDKYVIHSVATRPDQVHNINNFIHDAVQKYPDKFIGFGTLHPLCPDLEQEFERIVSLGLKGVKIHPDFQQFNIDSKEAMKMYEIIEGRLPLLVHTGDYRYDYSHPRRMANAVDAFPKLDVICAHFGGWSMWEEGLKYLVDKRVWIDSSSSLYNMSPQTATELVHKWGAERIFFGTDYPMWIHEKELERFNRLELTGSERQLILYDNAKKFFGLEE